MHSRHQTLDTALTPWHITWGTYGARLHGGAKATVDKAHNRRGEAFVKRDVKHEQAVKKCLNFLPVQLNSSQRDFIERELPAICRRGGWAYRICASGVDHVHLLCDIVPAIHGQRARRLAKRWLGQELSKCWPLPDGATWWAEEGSNIAIHDEAYLNNVFRYILRQRATPIECSPGSGTSRLPKKHEIVGASLIVPDPGGLSHTYRFHVNLFARPHCLIEAGCVELRGLQFARLCASSDEFAGVGDDPARLFDLVAFN
jgi:hypothetical protein